MSETIRIDRVEAFAFRAPTERAVATSFGVMRDRPAVFLRLTDADGAFGWGEIFANWPAAGAEHRAHLLIEDVSDLFLDASFTAPSELFHMLSSRTRIRALQCGEWGPFRQVIAGIDIAAHDLFARRAGLSVSRYLRADAPGDVAAYASGIHVNAGAESIPEAREAGHKAFKLKIGFDAGRDIDSLSAAAAGLQTGERLFTDANQAWSAAEALAFLATARDLRLGWLEEPIAADADPTDWSRLAATGAIPIAAGENIAGFDDFAAAIAGGHLSILQPDIAKWGGFTGCLAVARDAMRAGLTFCPHFLGGGIGLAASAHLLAAAGGEGLLEVDVNANPLRDAFDAAGGRVTDGRFRISDGVGLGITELPCDLRRYRTLALSRGSDETIGAGSPGKATERMR